MIIIPMEPHLVGCLTVRPIKEARNSSCNRARDEPHPGTNGQGPSGRHHGQPLGGGGIDSHLRPLAAIGGHWHRWCLVTSSRCPSFQALWLLGMPVKIGIAQGKIVEHPCMMPEVTPRLSIFKVGFRPHTSTLLC